MIFNFFMFTNLSYFLFLFYFLCDYHYFLNFQKTKANMKYFTPFWLKEKN